MKIGPINSSLFTPFTKTPPPQKPLEELPVKKDHLFKFGSSALAQEVVHPGNSGGGFVFREKEPFFSGANTPSHVTHLPLQNSNYHFPEIPKDDFSLYKNKKILDENISKIIKIIPQNENIQYSLEPKLLTPEILAIYKEIASSGFSKSISEKNIKHTDREHIVETAESEVLREAYALAKGVARGSRIHEDAILNCCILLAKRNSPLTDNLLRLFVGAIKAGRITTKEELYRILLEITTQVLINQYIRASSDEERQSAKSGFESIAMADNPPYSLKHQKEKAVALFQDVVRAHTRVKAIRHAFSVLIFDSMRPPTKESPLLLRFGHDISNTAYWINARDIHSFPGRGFIFSGLRLEKMLVLDETSEDLFKIYEEAWKIPKEDIERVRKTNFIITRGAIVVSSPEDKSCEITVGSDGRKVHYSYVVFNDHFGGKDFVHNGSESFYLVPTEIIEQKLKDTLIPYEDFTGFDVSKKDINDQGFNIYDIQKEAESLGLPVLHLGSGSTFSGGFTNSWRPGKKWFFRDEFALRKFSGVMTDAWGHTHKGDILRSWRQNWSEEWDKKMVPFRQAHKEVNAVIERYQNRLDVCLLGYADWLKGTTEGEVIDEVQIDEYLAVNDKKEKEDIEKDDDDFWRGDVHPKEEEPIEPEPGSSELSAFDLRNARQHLEFSGNPNEIFKNPNSMRALVEAYKWHNGLKEQSKEDKDLYPVFALGPSTNLWGIEESPFYLDTFDMTLRVGDKVYKLPDDKTGKGDFEAEELWYEFVVPHLLRDNAIRLYHRKDLKSVMKGVKINEVT